LRASALQIVADPPFSRDVVSCSIRREEGIPAPAPPAPVDLDGPVLIGPRTYWVGHELRGDPFQCHAYLVEHGDQSMLIDPGSALTFSQVRRKVEQIIPFSHVRYFVCQHPDPDIVGAMPIIDAEVRREDAVVVTHWRAAALLKHLALRMPSLLVEEHDWAIDLGGRAIRFVFTPYLHFPGAFCTFDTLSGALFSSDLFGGFTAGRGLYAGDESYFEDIRAFHEHYMPSREILVHGLLRLEQLPIQLIAPQHGRIIPEPLVRPIIERLKGLDCGLYLMTRSDTDIHRLVLLNTLLRDFMATLLHHRDFSAVAAFLLERAGEALPVDALSLYVDEGESGVACFGPENRYHGEMIEPPLPVRHALDGVLGAGRAHHVVIPGRAFGDGAPDRERLLIPLSAGGQGVRAVAVFHATQPIEVSAELDEILGRLALPLGIAVEREALHRQLEHERDKLYELSIHDALTGLYTRRYLDDAGRRMVELHDRDGAAGLCFAMFDVDRFKAVNDTHGHPAGDAVLKAVGKALRSAVRSPDVPARYGGEEFALAGAHVRRVEDGAVIAERVRQAVGALRFDGKGGPFGVTISAGVALHQQGESLARLIKRADTALYEAKASGRDRVICSPA
jgi:diguanylate cyclase (GGDEF)-like protein